MTKKEDEKIFAFLCYIPLIGIIIFLLTRKERKEFSEYHAKQGLVFTIAFIILLLIHWIFSFIPILNLVVHIVVVVLIVIFLLIGMINSLTGKRKPLPLIGHYAKNLTF